MSDLYGSYAERSRVGARASTQTLFAQVMFLVGVAIGFLALGAVVGHNLSWKTGEVLSFAGVGMILIQSFVPSLRYGSIGIAWLFAFALLFGLGLGPVLNYYAQTQPATIAQAAGGTALTTVAMGAYGLATSKDLARWARPLGFAMLGVFVIALIGLLVGFAGSPLLSLAILAISAAYLIVYFNLLRRHATEDDVVWIATGIFVGIINIFLSLLNLLGGRN
jgi:modulator of FtsH protease